MILLHGGPGGPGYMAPVGRFLGSSFRVLEPMQRASGDEPLTVDLHIADLHQVVTTSFPTETPTLLGSSWGAMLALAYAAAHPEPALPLVLIGSGTFDEASRLRYKETVATRMTPEVGAELDRLRVEVTDADECFRQRGEAMLPLFSYETTTNDLELLAGDFRGHHETWNDMLRLLGERVYPAAFAIITSPVLMLHGSHDPHPGQMIRESLEPHLPQLRYHELARCGHYPWIERHARDEFFEVLTGWLHDIAGPDRLAGS